MSKIESDKNIPGDVTTYVGAPGEQLPGYQHQQGDEEKADAHVQRGQILVDGASECS